MMPYRPLYIDELGRIDWQMVKNDAFRHACRRSIFPKPDLHQIRESLEQFRIRARAEQRRWYEDRGLPFPKYDSRPLRPCIGWETKAPRRLWA